VVYLALPNGPSELYSVAITGLYSDSVKISGTLVAGGNVQYYSGFQFSPDGSRVVYRADQDTDEVIELYVTDEGQINFKVYLPLVQR
jgi:Tol biopolymer transport system component